MQSMNVDLRLRKQDGTCRVSTSFQNCPKSVRETRDSSCCDLTLLCSRVVDMTMSPQFTVLGCSALQKTSTTAAATSAHARLAHNSHGVRNGAKLIAPGDASRVYELCIPQGAL